jgi:hypothetical protein
MRVAVRRLRPFVLLGGLLLGVCAPTDIEERITPGMTEGEVREELGAPSAEITDSKKIDTLTVAEKGCQRDKIVRILVYDYLLPPSALVYLDSDAVVVCSVRAAVKIAPDVAGTPPAE